MTRLALIGYGRIAPKHLEVFRALGAEFVASCNRSDEGRRRAETEGGIPRTYARIHEMLERERPEGIVSCASLHTQHAVARELLPYGIPTLLEKPPGLSYDEYGELCELAARHKTPVMVAVNRRHYSVVQRAVADAGGWGAIEAVSVDWSESPQHLLNRGFTLEQVKRTNFSNSLHGLDLMTYLAGPIDDAQVAARDFGEPARWMMSLQGVSRRGALASFQSTWDSPGRWRVAFCSPGRRYVFAPLETCQVQEAGSRELRTIDPSDEDQQFKPGFYRQAQCFLDTIRSNEVPESCGLEAVGPAMQLAEQLTRACLAAGPETADNSLTTGRQ